MQVQGRGLHIREWKVCCKAVSAPVRLAPSGASDDHAVNNYRGRHPLEEYDWHLSLAPKGRQLWASFLSLKVGWLTFICNNRMNQCRNEYTVWLILPRGLGVVLNYEYVLETYNLKYLKLENENITWRKFGAFNFQNFNLCLFFINWFEEWYEMNWHMKIPFLRKINENN